MFADALEPFRQITADTPTPNAYSYLKELDQEKTCRIAVAASLGTMLGQGLGPEKGVVKFLGRVQRASWSDVSSVPRLICES